MHAHAAESVGDRCQGANNFEIARATCFMQRPRAVFAARPGYYGFHRLLDQWSEERTVALMQCPLMTDTVEKVVSGPPKRNNRIRTARYLNRNCVRGRDFESMLRIQGRKIVFQQYRPKADIGLPIRSPRRRARPVPEAI